MMMMMMMMPREVFVRALANRASAYVDPEGPARRPLRAPPAGRDVFRSAAGHVVQCLGDLKAQKQGAYAMFLAVFMLFLPFEATKRRCLESLGSDLASFMDGAGAGCRETHCGWGLSSEDLTSDLSLHVAKPSILHLTTL